MQTGKDQRLDWVRVGIVITALVTAFIHISIALRLGGYLFILNGLGYLALLAALLLPLPVIKNHRRLVRLVFIAYTLLTIVLWLVMGTRDALAYVDKLAELILIALLWLDRRRG